MNMQTRDEQRTEDALAADASRIDVGAPPLGDIIGAGTRTRRRRTFGVGVAAAALAVGGVVGVTTWGGASDGQREQLQVAEQPVETPPVPAPTAALPSAGPGQWLQHSPVPGDEPASDVREQWLEGGDPSTPREYRILWPANDDLLVGASEPDPVMFDAQATDAELKEWLFRDSGDLRGLDAAKERLGGAWHDVAVPLEFKARLIPVALDLKGVELRDEPFDVAGRSAFVIDMVEGTQVRSHHVFAVDSHEYLGSGYDVTGETEAESYGSESLMTTTVVDELPQRARGPERGF